MPDQSPNALIHSSSPYLKQHAHNPVHWEPWSQEVFERAARENKLVLISIGYSACHWCHVMERECFEDHEVAEAMNAHFISVKVDREERPDVDQVYMSAVQLMTGRGGWPLNCFTMPDGRPVYGGTYFPKKQWLNVLLQLSTQYRESKSSFEEYASRLTEGVNRHEEVSATADAGLITPIELNGLVTRWKDEFDLFEGGTSRAPKFPMPVNLRFLLHYGIKNNDAASQDHVALTLLKMASGGIYDQLGGGFARYSVDILWKVPHFEKMLYDNAQLVSLYAESFKHKGDPLYRQVAIETLKFMNQEFAAADGGFYCALDADSEGEEGKFYAWSELELRDALGERYDLAAAYFHVDEKGLWEHGRYILLRNADEEFIARNHGLTVQELHDVIDGIKNELLEIRNKRIRPGLDDKRLTSWNALAVIAFADAFEAIGDRSYLEKSISTLDVILKKATDEGGGLYHTFGSKEKIAGFLEDYANVIRALIRVYQASGIIGYLEQARKFTDHTLRYFDNASGSMFYFTASTGEQLISRKTELQDNVIPGSNSEMAINLFLLGNYFGLPVWVERSHRMMSVMRPHAMAYPQAYANWLLLSMMHGNPLQEFVVCGPDAIKHMNQIRSRYLPPWIITIMTTGDETLPATYGRLVPGKTLFYVCTGHTCSLPVEDPLRALALLTPS